jgi:hypothetical protein
VPKPPVPLLSEVVAAVRGLRADMREAHRAMGRVEVASGARTGRRRAPKPDPQPTNGIGEGGPLLAAVPKA